MWTPAPQDVGYNKLTYSITYNTTKDYEVYFEDGIEKLKPASFINCKKDLF